MGGDAGDRVAALAYPWDTPNGVGEKAVILFPPRSPPLMGTDGSIYRKGASMIFYEATLKGRAGGQDIRNVLYYIDATDPGADYSVATAEALADDLVAAAPTQWLPSLPQDYVFEGVDVRGINELRETVSPFVTEAAATGNGTILIDTEGPGSVGIVAFRTVPMVAGTSVRNPRRSYIAHGPIPEDNVANDGSLQWPAQVTNALTNLLLSPRTLGTTTLEPVRVGVPNAAGIPAVGAIVDVIFRPFVSFRRSRSRRPSGGA